MQVFLCHQTQNTAFWQNSLSIRNAINLIRCRDDDFLQVIRSSIYTSACARYILTLSLDVLALFDD